MLGLNPAELLSSISWTWVGLSAACIAGGVALILLLKQFQTGGLLILVGVGLGYMGWLYSELHIAQAQRDKAEAAAKAAQDVADRWIAVAAEQNTAVDALRREGAARRATAAAALRKEAERALSLQAEIDALEARLRSEGAIPVAEAILAVRKATDALP